MSDTANSPVTMRGWAINGYGGEIVLMDDLPVPTPGPHDILIRMRSAEVGIWDELVRTGACDVERPFPLVLGLGGAGTIVAVGVQVKGFAAGQYVYAYSYPLADNGFWAEYMLVPDNYVAQVPASITPMEAGGLPIAGLSAHESLIDLLGVKGAEAVIDYTEEDDLTKAILEVFPAGSTRSSTASAARM